jgi:iron complex transport system ATP-binding protein
MGIEVKNLSFSYKKGIPVLHDVNFQLQSGKFICLLGPNGVGKSTLFKCMLGLLRNYTGEILIDGENTRSLTQKQLARKVAYIPQSTAPVFNYTVADVVLMGTTSLTSGFSSPGEKERVYVTQALETLNIQHLRDRMFMNISGGERQLVLVARALAQQAGILFMDEPTANLDYGNQVRVLEQVRRLSGSGYTVIQSTHNPEQAFLYADEVLAVKDGTIAAHGSPNKVMDAGLIRDLYGIEAQVESLMDDRMRVCIPVSSVKMRI